MGPSIRFPGGDMITLTVNGATHQVDAPPDMPLLWALRDLLGLTGVKFGCGVARCGACLVHIDGLATPACATPVGAVEGTDITTIEGLSGPEADALRRAWVERDVAQCGYCQSGQIMGAAALLARIPDPTDAQIENALARNLCRCATYGRIRAAVRAAADALEV